MLKYQHVAQETQAQSSVCALAEWEQLGLLQEGMDFL